MIIYNNGTISVPEKNDATLANAVNMSDICMDECSLGNLRYENGRAYFDLDCDRCMGDIENKLNKLIEFLHEIGITDILVDINISGECEGKYIYKEGKIAYLSPDEVVVRETASTDELIAELKRRGCDVIKTDDLIKDLRESQVKAAKCIGFIAGMVSQIWVINDLLGKIIEDYGGEPYKVENGKLIIKNKENKKVVKRDE